MTATPLVIAENQDDLSKFRNHFVLRLIVKNNAVMLNLFQHLNIFETLKQVQGDVNARLGGYGYDSP